VKVSEKDLELRMARFKEACKKSGAKLTHQRMEIFRELAATAEHPDAETIYRQVRRRVPAISRDTVYRTLSALEERGIVRKAEILFSRGRYDANMEQHHHFVCTQCGLVRDFYSEALDGLPIPKPVRAMGSVESAHVQLRGICSACAEQKQKKGSRK